MTLKSTPRGQLLRGSTSEDVEIWWRADDKRYANYDPWAEFEQPAGSHLKIELTPYAVYRHTAKGVFLREGSYVRGAARKQFAVPTKELALSDLVVRKMRHVAGCRARLAQAEEHLREAQLSLKREQERLQMHAVAS